MIDNERIEELAEQFRTRVQLLESYQCEDSPEGVDKDTIETMLRRYNEVWETDAADYWEEDRPDTVNFVHETFPEEIYESVSHPFFRRTSFIRQLSTTPLQRHLGASHSRLAHSYGVGAIARAFINSLEEDGVHIPDTKRKAVYIYCYVHDAFHGPFGHSLDSLKGYFSLSDPKKKLDKNILYDEITEGGKVYENIHSNHDPDEAADIVEFLKFLTNPGVRERQVQYSDYYFLTQIVDSVIDADRLDYLHRDAYNLGLSEPMDPNLRTMINSVGVQEMESRRGEKVRTLSWNERYSEDIEELLQSRRKFYREYYESEDKLAIDEMLSHALYNFLEHFDIDAGDGGDLDPDIMRRLAYLTDTELIHFLREVGQPFITNELIRDLYRGHFYVPIKEYELPFPQDVDPEEADPDEGNAFDAFNSALSMEKPTPPFTPEELGEIRHATEVAGLDLSHLLFIMSDFMIDQYHKKAHIEGLLRDQIMDNNFLYDEWRELNIRKYGMFEEIDEVIDNELMRWDKYTRIPFIYIYFPTHVEWLSGSSRRGDNNGDAVKDDKFWIKEKEPTTIHWHDDNKDPVDINLDIPLREEFESKRVILCGPQPFSTGEAKSELCDIFEDMIRSKDLWMQHKILGSG